MSKSTRLSMVSTKAAVFPVPDCDCPIIFVGLYDGISAIVERQSEDDVRVTEQER